MFSLAPEGSNRKRIALASHRAWLLRGAEALFSFFARRIRLPTRLAGFYNLDDKRQPRYCLSRGPAGSDIIIDHGTNFLRNSDRDSEYGGYYWSVGYDGPSDATKEAYGHAFVLLAASSAKAATSFAPSPKLAPPHS